MVLQLDIASLGLRTLCFLPPFVGLDAGHDEQCKMNNPVITYQHSQSY